MISEELVRREAKSRFTSSSSSSSSSLLELEAPDVYPLLSDWFTAALKSRSESGVNEAYEKTYSDIKYCC